MANRYDMRSDEEYEEMVQDPSGERVAHQDYADLESKLATAEQALILIGEKAVVDWDDATVGAVDTVVKDPKRYKDWLRDTMVTLRSAKVTQNQIENVARIIDGIDGEISRVERYREVKAKGGQHVPCHSDFIGVNISSMQRLKWWMRHLRKALEEEQNDD